MVFRIPIIANGNSVQAENLYQIEEPDITQSAASSTSIVVKISMVGVAGTPTSFIVKYQPLASDGITLTGSEQTITSNTNSITVAGLSLGTDYRIKTQLSNSSGVGNIMSVSYYLSSNPELSGKVGVAKNINEKVTAKSYLSISGTNQPGDKRYSVAYKNFDSIQLPVSGTNYTNVDITEIGPTRTVKNYDTEIFYSFGTSVIFNPNVKEPVQAAAIGFFLGGEKVDTGYFLEIMPQKSASALGTNTLQIYKLAPGKQIKKLSISGKGNSFGLASVFAGRVYNIDIKVKVYQKTVTITAYINGFKIEASDTTTAAAKNEILDVSKKVGLVGILGTSLFDYVYADTINADQYAGDYQALNFYSGQFSTDFLDHAYGDLLYNFNNQDLDIVSKKNAFDEFGTVVRELYYRKVQFSQSPVTPIKWSVGANRSVVLLSQTYNQFGAEVLLLNNTSVTVPVSDQGVNSLAMLANPIGDSGQIQYSTSPPSPYSQVQPITLETKWLQNESDVSKLAEFIQNKAINKSKIVSMEVFGNPLISTGDVITINYPYQKLDTAIKFIVIKVKQSFGEGLKTEITARTI